MSRDEWSLSEKKIARRAFDRALRAADGRVQGEGGRGAGAGRSAVARTVLEEQRRDIDDVFDYRYSRLLWSLRC